MECGNAERRGRQCTSRLGPSRLNKRPQGKKTRQMDARSRQTQSSAPTSVLDWYNVDYNQDLVHDHHDPHHVKFDQKDQESRQPTFSRKEQWFMTKAGMKTPITGFGPARLTRRPRSFSRWHTHTHTCMRSAEGRGGPGDKHPDHTGRKSSPRFGFAPPPPPPPLPLEASELLADQRCLTQKSGKKSEHRDGTRLIHDAILVSGVLPETQSYSHTLPHHPGGLLSAFMGYPSTPSNLLFLIQFLRTTL